MTTHETSYEEKRSDYLKLLRARTLVLADPPSYTMRRMLMEGLVEVVKKDKRFRGVHIALTDKGRKLLAQP